MSEAAQNMIIGCVLSFMAGLYVAELLLMIFINKIINDK